MVQIVNMNINIKYLYDSGFELKTAVNNKKKNLTIWLEFDEEIEKRFQRCFEAKIVQIMFKKEVINIHLWKNF